MRSHQLQQQKGFTLLETLVAIAVMTVAMGAAFSMAQKSLFSSYAVRNQTTAYFLASEGLELVRTIRDNVSFYNAGKGTALCDADWLAPLRSSCMSIAGSYGCDIDPASTNLMMTDSGLGDSGAIISCNPGSNPNADATGCKLVLATLAASPNPDLIQSLYTSRLSGAPTPYTRQIKITERTIDDGSCKKEAEVVSEVTWKGETARVVETLTNWH